MTDDVTFEWKKYIITKGSIGKGTFSKVYYGYHKETGIEIAMKKIKFTSLQNDIKDKVISEIHILQKMDHPNIMKLYEYHFDGEYIILITEYCNNNNLDTWMKTERRHEEIIAVITQIAHGIRYMHSNHILHRDIKPENILFHNDMIKICDFGFSIIIKEHHEMMKTICGTPLFMSPEILFLKPYTSKSDIWAFGILCYMMIYRLHPYGRLTSLDEYRVKIKRPIIFIPIDIISYLVDMIKLMLSHDETMRPDIGTITYMLQSRSTDVSEVPHEVTVVEETDEPTDPSQMGKEELLHRINELQEEIFELEERSQSNSCCFGLNVTEVTGRGRTNKGYELAITNDYFTPPETSFGSGSSNAAFGSSNAAFGSGAAFASQSSGISIPRISSSRSSSTPTSFLSTSLEKLSALFHSLRSKSSSHSGY